MPVLRTFCGEMCRVGSLFFSTARPLQFQFLFDGTLFLTIRLRWPRKGLGGVVHVTAMDEVNDPLGEINPA
jgi:hypothetical protein